MRIRLFEFEDFSWFPAVLRDGGTDYLKYFLFATDLYHPCVPLLRNTLKRVGENRVLDLCSGSGGYIEKVVRHINYNTSDRITITLTDKFPNIPAFESIRQNNSNYINYISYPVNVFSIPEELEGTRTMFSAIHHFKPAEVRLILQEAVNARKAICIFDGERTLLAIAGILILHPILFLILTPFFKPLKFSRFFFTYIIPLIPLYTIWDGVASVLSMYEPEELKAIAQSIDSTHFVWEAGKTRNKFGLRANYLIGYPQL